MTRPMPARLKICPGSNQKPLSRFGLVGICLFCGVRTFVLHGEIQPHECTRQDVADHRRRGPRQAKGSA